MRLGGSGGKQFIGKYYKGKKEKRQRVSLLGIAIQHVKALNDLKEREALGKCVDESPANLEVAIGARHSTEYELTQARWVLEDIDRI